MKKIRKIALLVCMMGLVGCDSQVPVETSESDTTISEVNGKVIYVSQNHDADFDTISDAIASAEGETTIIIEPGIYDEIISIVNKDISLVGTDRDTCIIQNTTGLYCNAPVSAGGHFNIENLTMKMTLENAGEWKPTYEENVQITYPGYALHIDSPNLANTNTVQIGTVKNCVCYSEAFPAVGCGIQENQRIIFEDCIFIRNTPSEDFHRDRWQGAFVGHSSNYEVKNQYLELKRCVFKTNYGNAANFLMTLAGEKYAEITAIDNTFWSEELQTDDCVDYAKGNSILNSMSRGNTAECLNAE